MIKHPVFWLGRKLTPSLRSVDEKPLSLQELYHIIELFGGEEVETWFLLMPMAYPVRFLPGGEALFRRLHACLTRLDTWIFNQIPVFRHWAWYGVIKIRKPL